MASVLSEFNVGDTVTYAGRTDANRPVGVVKEVFNEYLAKVLFDFQPELVTVSFGRLQHL